MRRGGSVRPSPEPWPIRPAILLTVHMVEEVIQQAVRVQHQMLQDLIK